MRTYDSRKKKSSSIPVVQTQALKTHQPAEMNPLTVQAKSNEEGLAEWEAQRQKWERFGSSWMDKVPNPSGELAQPWIQRKLTLGPPRNNYEQESDRVASQIARQISAPISSATKLRPSIQRDKELEEEKQAKISSAAIQHRQAVSSREASLNLETAINNARGGGQPLDQRLQQSMGQAMGAEFSGVRVHTNPQSDQLNQSIQARAFTTGRDVFFRDGEYQPGNRVGQELIAHELTHVLQQSPDNVRRKPPKQIINCIEGEEPLTIQHRIEPSTISRAVGFEFQTVGQNNIKVYQNAHDKDAIWPWGGATTLEELDGFKVTTDGKDLEIITDAVEETDVGDKDLMAIMLSVTSYIESLIKAQKTETVTGEYVRMLPKKVKEKKAQQDIEESDYAYLTVVDKPFAHPQATAGVRIEAIPRLFEEILKEENQSWAFSDYTLRERIHKKNLSDKLTDLKPELNTDKISPKLRGFLTFLASYIATGVGTQKDFKESENGPPGNYPKDSVAVMARSNLADVAFEALSSEDRAKYVELVITGQIREFLKIDVKDYQAGLWHENYSREYVTPPTVEAFIKSLIPDKDKLGLDLTVINPDNPVTDSMGQLSTKNLGHNKLKDKMGKKSQAMKSASDIGPDNSGDRDKSGVIIELRDLSRGIGYEDWPKVTTTVFKMILKINAHDENNNNA